MSKIVLIENTSEFAWEAKKLCKEFQTFLGIKNLSQVRVLNCYSFLDITEEDYKDLVDTFLFDEKIDTLYTSLNEVTGYDQIFRVAHKDGQYNQREDMMREVLKIKYDSQARVKTSKILLFKGINEKELEKIKSYYINQVDSKELALDDFSFEKAEPFHGPIAYVDNFISMDTPELEKLQEDLSMDMDDLLFVQEYFKKENRNPSVCELKMIDTYWSDHCRHTTFLTEITDITIPDGLYKDIFTQTLEEYKKSRDYVHGGKKPLTLMDLATINMKELKKKGILNNLEDTDEVNACSIEIKADIDGKDEDYLLMFKNETHNHPTEIEPYGGAHTCIGGGIRDPLSARSYVFQAMRLVGAKNPLTKYEDTMENKLPQRKLAQMAMQGYSDYGNQIGCTGGYVKEFYHDGFEAKRMELGALVSGVKKSDILRAKPTPGDVILLLGARTGRDGLGAAVGSSKVQTVKSLEKAGAEVQKGNPYEERNIIRLFRNPKATKLIKKCNDFGAGGVSVAIGELADGLSIDLSQVKLKYDGLNDWEIALSESQERMAVVVAPENLDTFLQYVKEADVDYSIVAKVTDENRVHMVLDGQTSVDVKREFLNTNGAKKQTKAILESPKNVDYLFNDTFEGKTDNEKENLKKLLSDINVASQKNIISNFNNSIGRGTVLSQLGGKNALTPQEGMVAKLPIPNGKTKTCSIMTYGYDPYLSEQNEFLGGYYAVLTSIAKQVALGADVDRIRLSFQEFYERLVDEKKWGKPLKSLLGAYKVLHDFELATIGGKDSMSGTFKDVHVPPSLLSFAVSYEDIDHILSKEFKKENTKVLFVEIPKDEKGLVDLKATKEIYKKIKKAVDQKLILSMSSVEGGIAKTVLEMGFGNHLGLTFEKTIPLYTNYLGSLLLEVEESDLKNLTFSYEILGTTKAGSLTINGNTISLDELTDSYLHVLDDVYPDFSQKYVSTMQAYTTEGKKHASVKTSSPKVILPIFKGTIGEYDLQAAFEKAGAIVEPMVFKFRSKKELESSIAQLAEKLPNYDILALASGAVMGNEPEQKGAILDFVLGHDLLKDSLNAFAQNPDKLILGIGESLQSLLRLGLIEFGKIQSGTGLRVLQNEGEKYVSAMADIKAVSSLSPFMNQHTPGDIYQAPLGIQAGKIYADQATLDKLAKNGQIASVFENINLTNSCQGIEALSSPDGTIFACLSGIDKIDSDLYKNLAIHTLPKMIAAAVAYFA